MPFANNRLTHLLLLATIVLWGCTNDATDIAPTDDAVPVEITFQLSAQGETATRATRPLTSSDNWQRTTNVRIYIFKSDTEDGDYTYYQQKIQNTTFDYTYVPGFEKTTWAATDVWGDTDSEGREERHSYRLRSLLPAGYYKFLAIGRDDISESSEADKMMSLCNLEAGTTKIEDVVLTCTSTSRLNACEIFTGVSEILPVTTERVKTTSTITLTRAVAGLLMYVENIPSQAGSPLNDVKAIGIEHIKASNGVTAASKATYTGSATPSARVIVKQAVTGTVVNGYYTNTTTNQTDIDAGHPNSVCAGAFITPQALTTIADGTSTLKLILYGEGDTKLKTYKIKILTNPHEGESELHYSMHANHFYSVGKRNITDGENEPIDLGHTSEDIIMVLGGWQEIVDIQL